MFLAVQTTALNEAIAGQLGKMLLEILLLDTGE